MNTAHNPSSEAGAQPGRLPADRIQAITQEIASAAHIPRISIAVATPDKVLYAGAVGYSDLARRRLAQPEDQYLWFSMTKIATATAAMRLHADGLLDLDAPSAPTCPATGRTRGTVTPQPGSCSPTPPDWATRYPWGGSAPSINRRSRLGSAASSASTAHHTKRSALGPPTPTSATYWRARSCKRQPAARSRTASTTWCSTRWA